MEPSRSMLRIFVGCTSVDLKDHRHAARRLIEKFDEHAVVMEDFGAQNGDASQVSLAELASAHVYILLLAWRYGTTPSDEKLSVTHLEYRTAKDANMPRLIFLADPATEKDDGPDAFFPATVRDSDHAKQVLAFRSEVGHDRVADFFTTPESAALAVAAALHRFLREREPTRPYPPFKLAPRAPEFVGRTRELADLCQRLRAGQSVGLSALVSGLGGIGKSALAAEALATLAGEPDAFPGGVTWVRCDGREGLAGLAWLYDQLLADWGAPLAPEQVAQAQTAGPDAEVELRERALQTRLRESAPALVLLDNVEVGLPLARALDTLSALHITTLITARHQPFLSRLAVVRLDVLDASAAVQLFAERYREKGGDWDDARDAKSAENVVDRLGWLPLAIELQAAHATLRQVSVAQLSDDLERDRSQGLIGDPLPSHQPDAERTMRYSFERSLRTLTSLQRTRFAALGLPGGPDWPRSVIERLLAGISVGDDSTAAETAEIGETPESDDELSASGMASARVDLDLLVALSLASQLPEGRVRLHPLLREFAHELWLGEPLDTQRQGLYALLAVIANLVADCGYNFASLQKEEELIVTTLKDTTLRQEQPATIITLIEMLENYLVETGRWYLGKDLFDIAFNASHLIGDSIGECRALNARGILEQNFGNLKVAKLWYEKARIVAHNAGDSTNEAIIWNNLGCIAESLGRSRLAQKYYRKSLSKMRRVKWLPQKARVFFNLAQSEMHSASQRSSSVRNLKKALKIAEENGDSQIRATILLDLAFLLEDIGYDPDTDIPLTNFIAIGSGIMTGAEGQQAAKQYYEGALELMRKELNRLGEFNILNHLGNVSDRLGRLEEAKTHYEQALAIAREIGARRDEGIILNDLGNLASRLGQPDQARDYYKQALNIFKDIEDVDNAGIVAKNLSYLDDESSLFDDLPSEELSITPGEGA